MFFFEFDEEVKRQKSETAIGTKFKLPYACIFKEKVKIESFNFFIMEFPIIQKPVYWFAKQISGLVSILYETPPWKS